VQLKNQCDKPTRQGSPRSSDNDNDNDAATIGEPFLRHVNDHQDAKKKKRRALYDIYQEPDLLDLFYLLNSN